MDESLSFEKKKKKKGASKAVDLDSAFAALDIHSQVPAAVDGAAQAAKSNGSEAVSGTNKSDAVREAPMHCC